MDSIEVTSHKAHVLIGCTGSVASIKIPLLVQELQKLIICNHSLEVKIIATEHAMHFFSVDDLDSVCVYRDEDEWSIWEKVSDPVLHIELRRWADILVIAPLDANTLAKISNGLCDNLLTSVVRAWDLQKPLLFCPAMNTFMWEHPITRNQVANLKEYGYKEIPCIAKKLACGDLGKGAMAEVSTIIDNISIELEEYLSSKSS